MDSATIPGLLNWIDQTKQTVKSGIGLLADNPSEWAAQVAARYFPTKEEERQFNALRKSGAPNSALYDSPYLQKILNLSQFQGSPLWKNLGQKAVSENVRKLGEAPTEFNDFTFILSDRQKEILQKRLKEMNANEPRNYSVEVSKYTNALHPNESRIKSNTLPKGLLGDLYEMVYKEGNKIGIASDAGDRFYLVNLNDKFPDGQKAVGMFEINKQGDIYPATAFPSSPFSAEGKTRKR